MRFGVCPDRGALKSFLEKRHMGAKDWRCIVGTGTFYGAGVYTLSETTRTMEELGTLIPMGSTTRTVDFGVPNYMNPEDMWVCNARELESKLFSSAPLGANVIKLSPSSESGLMARISTQSAEFFKSENLI